MLFTSPIPFKEALDFLRQKVLLPTAASSAQLAELPAQILARAQFSAKTTNAGYLQTIQDLTDQLLSGPSSVVGRPSSGLNPATMRLKLKEALQSISYHPVAAGVEPGTIQDLSSDPRLNLIIQMQTDMALGFGKFLQSQDPDALNAFPAQELFRAEARREPRDWPSRWADAGGDFYGGGRMIALKDDPIWTAISAFDLPYPPFDYGSGMWVRDISRSEAEQFGLVAPGETVEPLNREPLDFNQGLQASLQGLSEGLQKAILDSMPGAKFLDGILYLKNSASKISNPEILNISNFSQGQPRDSLGRWVDASGGGLSEKENLQRGNNAIHRALRRKQDVRKAMHRKELGQIDFLWGTPGEKAEDYSGGWGISHIAAKHGPETTALIPTIVAKGDVMPHPQSPEKSLIRYERHFVSLVKQNDRQAWVLTGHKE